MNKTVTYLLIAITAASLIFAGYSYNRANTIQIKYEEALVDVEEATVRLEEAKQKLEVALKDSEEHRKRAEDALAELEKHKAKK